MLQVKTKRDKAAKYIKDFEQGDVITFNYIGEDIVALVCKKPLVSTLSLVSLTTKDFWNDISKNDIPAKLFSGTLEEA